MVHAAVRKIKERAPPLLLCPATKNGDQSVATFALRAIQAMAGSF
jgi:hypothetical protein